MRKYFPRLIGNEETKHRLGKAIDSGTMPHAFLIGGPSGSGKSTFVQHLNGLIKLPSAQKKYKTMPLVDLERGKESPYLKVMWREGANIARYAEQLCLSPVGRARMGVLAAKKEIEDDPTAAFFDKYGN